MKPLFITLLTLFSLHSIAQENVSSGNAPSMLLGANLNSIISFSDTPDRYSLYPTVNGGSYLNKTNKSLSNFFQLEGEFRWNHFYVSGGVGIGWEKIDLTATNFSEWGSAGAGGSTYSRTTYDLTMKEDHSYLIASVEGGYLFNKPSNRFRFGLGLGFDFNTDLSSSIRENTLIRNTTTQTSGGPNQDSYNNTTTEEYDNTSEQWSSTVGNAELFGLMPKVGLSGYYSINEKIGLSLKANTRFLFYRRYSGADLQLKVRFPVSLGVYFKL